MNTFDPVLRGFTAPIPLVCPTDFDHHVIAVVPRVVAAIEQVADICIHRLLRIDECHGPPPLAVIVRLAVASRAYSRRRRGAHRGIRRAGRHPRPVAVAAPLPAIEATRTSVDAPRPTSRLPARSAPAGLRQRSE